MEIDQEGAYHSIQERDFGELNKGGSSGDGKPGADTRCILVIHMVEFEGELKKRNEGSHRYEQGLCLLLRTDGKMVLGSKDDRDWEESMKFTLDMLI